MSPVPLILPGQLTLGKGMRVGAELSGSTPRVFFGISGDFAGFRVEAGVVVVFDLTATFDVGDDERDEVLVTVGDRGVFDRVGVVLSGPGGLSGGAVAIQSSAGGGYPVAQALPCVGEVTEPTDGGAAVLLRVVGVEPVGVQRGQFPQQLGMPVPHGRDNRGR